MSAFRRGSVQRVGTQVRLDSVFPTGRVHRVGTELGLRSGFSTAGVHHAILEQSWDCVLAFQQPESAMPYWKRAGTAFWLFNSRSPRCHIGRELGLRSGFSTAGVHHAILEESWDCVLAFQQPESTMPYWKTAGTAFWLFNSRSPPYWNRCETDSVFPESPPCWDRDAFRRGSVQRVGP